MPWRAIKFNNGGVITDDSVYFKICSSKATAQALFDTWKKAKDERIPVPTFALTQMNARQLTGDNRLPDGPQWGLSTNRATGTFYQLSKVNKVNAAATAILALGADDQKRIAGVLQYAVDLHMADTQFFLDQSKIRFIDIGFVDNSNDPNLRALLDRVKN